jgi:hypothetical protein
MIHLDRDSVCAGDDTESHESHLSLPLSATLADLLTAVSERHYLASISGGKATWLIQIAGRKDFIGVIAQQWETPRLLLPAETKLSVLLSGTKPAVFFRYREQSDPELVFSCLASGNELPK